MGVLAPAPSAGAAEPYCGITWGSLDKTASGGGGGLITNLRAGQNECWDRLVFDLNAPGGAGYSVRYVPVVTEDGSGNPVPLAGGAFLQIAVVAHDFDPNTGVPTYQPADRYHAVNVTGFQTFRQVFYQGSFEGVTTAGLGVRARLPFRVFLLAGPGNGSRLVIDVAHRWS
ncbi:MAG TPA: hypothetical protein VH479_05860 [Acidimicrobiales bacterium]